MKMSMLLFAAYGLKLSLSATTCNYAEDYPIGACATAAADDGSGNVVETSTQWVCADDKASATHMSYATADCSGDGTVVNTVDTAGMFDCSQAASCEYASQKTYVGTECTATTSYSTRQWVLDVCYSADSTTSKKISCNDGGAGVTVAAFTDAACATADTSADIMVTTTTETTCAVYQEVTCTASTDGTDDGSDGTDDGSDGTDDGSDGTDDGTDGTDDGTTDGTDGETTDDGTDTDASSKAIHFVFSMKVLAFLGFLGLFA